MEKRNKLLKVGDWLLVTISTLQNDLTGQILEIEEVEKEDTYYTYRVKWKTTTRWVNGVAPTELSKALL